jgi:hypothetical protein
VAGGTAGSGSDPRVGGDGVANSSLNSSRNYISRRRRSRDWRNDFYPAIGSSLSGGSGGGAGGMLILLLEEQVTLHPLAHHKEMMVDQVQVQLGGGGGGAWCRRR